MLRTESNPNGTPLTVFDDLRAAIAADAAQFYRDFSAAFYGADREGAAVSRGIRDAFWSMSMQTGLNAALDCVRAFSETDFTDDLRHFDVPTLIAHGDDDQIVPIDASAYPSAELVPNATLKVYTGAPHGLANLAEFKDAFNADLLSFAEARAATPVATG